MEHPQGHAERETILQRVIVLALYWTVGAHLTWLTLSPTVMIKPADTVLVTNGRCCNALLYLNHTVRKMWIMVAECDR